MTKATSFVAYFDMLGIGDASLDDSEAYHDSLLRFRQAICDTVDEKLSDLDKVFAFSDCAFFSSDNLPRLAAAISKVQSRLWEHSLYVKGAITTARLDYNDFAALPGQSDEIIEARGNKLFGYWFSKEFVQPALMEKNLKGIAIQIDPHLASDPWVLENVTYTAHYIGDSLRKPSVVLDLLIPVKSLRYLETILKKYLIISHTSRRLSRYYIPLLVTWINSHSFKKTVYDPGGNSYELPLRQLTASRKLASEIVQLPGGDLIYYSLLSKVEKECDDQKVVESLVDFIGSSKRLRTAAESIPPEICKPALCRRVNETRIQQLFI